MRGRAALSASNARGGQSAKSVKPLIRQGFALPPSPARGEGRNHHIRNTPKVVSGIGAFSDAEIASPSTSRVWAGSMTPSSHRRAVA